MQLSEASSPAFEILAAQVRLRGVTRVLGKDSHMPSIGWGLIGTGEVSRSFAADLTYETGSRRVAVASRDARRAGAFARESRVERAYQGLEALLADPEVDVVHIGTPHGTHRDIALSALAAGKHIVVEKPIALNRSQAEEIASAAASAGLFAMEGMWMKFNPAYRAVLDTITAGDIGTPKSVRASFGVPFPTDTGSRWSAELGGSTLLDQGIYPITLVMAVLGTPTEISARGEVRPDGVDLTAHMTFEFGGGRYAQIAVSMIDFCEPTATVNGSSGWITLPTPFWAASYFQTHSGSDPEQLAKGIRTDRPSIGNGFTPMIQHVNEAVTTGLTQSPIHPLSDTLEVFDVLDEVRGQLLSLT